MLKTGEGIIADAELYDDECGFVFYIINPLRAGVAVRELGWFEFSVTYTFSGLKRPGAALNKSSIPMPLPVILDRTTA